MAAGYTFVHDEATLGGTVSDEVGTRKYLVVGVQENGHAQKAYAMEIPMKFYLEDQVAKQAEIDARESGMARGVVPGQEPLAHIHTNMSITRG